MRLYYIANRERVFALERERRASGRQKECAAKWRAIHAEQERERSRRKQMYRRALQKRGRAELVDQAIVFARDRGVCGICSGVVDPNEKWHVDHIHPISKGGEHTYSNVQLAHARCNLSKGTKVVAA